MENFEVGQKVVDRWYPTVVGECIEVGKTFIRVKFDNGRTVKYDLPHMRNYLVPAIFLRDVIPHEAHHYIDDAFYKHLDVLVLKENDGCEKRWIGSHKNVFNWWELANGIAVGWNENPATGWSFPIKKMKIPRTIIEK